LEETNMTGNVYFVNHLRWQGRCREMFLRDHAPGVLRELAERLTLLTVRCSCDYLAELAALDEISVRLFLDDLVLNRLVLRFEYWKVSGAHELVAQGSQEIACMRRTANGTTESVDIPEELRRALEPYRAEAHCTTVRR
jgi:enediyne biosynthesis thioesterase